MINVVKTIIAIIQEDRTDSALNNSLFTCFLRNLHTKVKSMFRKMYNIFGALVFLEIALLKTNSAQRYLHHARTSAHNSVCVNLPNLEYDYYVDDGRFQTPFEVDMLTQSRES